MDMKSVALIDISQPAFSAGWKIVYNQLYAIDPADVALVAGARQIESVWNMYFTDDLFQASNDTRQLFVDIGWAPGGDPKGSYEACLLNTKLFNAWKEPLSTFSTRSLDELRHWLLAVMN